jgi:hypothetical protein
VNRRLHIRLDEERHERLAAEASRRGVAIAVLVREAIDAVLPPRKRDRAAATRAILAAEPMPVPAPDALRSELDQLRARRS